MTEYVATIGIECHVQLKTKTKLFSGVDNDAREAAPNTLVSPICFGMPGVLPVLNAEAVELAIRAGLAMNAEVATFSKFDRKQYFYPDLPKGYQITQFDQPIVGKGVIKVPVGDDCIEVGITRAHMEEDAGKSTHPADKPYSLVDLNRAGTPLIEVVSEPDMHTPQEARAFAQELWLLMKFADVSNVNLYHGNMRFDVNISVAPKGSDKLGLRAEVKNLNSFRSVEKAAEYEFNRQVKLLEAGEEVVQETRGWDDVKMQTFSQRSKADAHDYRYFPEPDLPPIVIEQSHIDEIKASMPMLPPELREKLKAKGLTNEQVATILGNSDFVRIILTALDEERDDKAVKRMANWLCVDVQALLGSEEQITAEKLTYSHLSELYELIEANKLSSSAAKEVLAEVIAKGGAVEEIAKAKNIMQVSDSSAVGAIVDAVLAANPQAVSDLKNGEEKVIGFLVGQIMKESRGQANPQMAQTLIREAVAKL